MADEQKQTQDMPEHKGDKKRLRFAMIPGNLPEDEWPEAIEAFLYDLYGDDEEWRAQHPEIVSKYEAAFAEQDEPEQNGGK